MVNHNKSPVARRVDVSKKRISEDDIAQQELGGVKGSCKLKPAPLTNNEKEQHFPNDDVGHTA